ncbi:MAG: carbohydrate ABC transporter permease [Desulfotomaculum sp.]|nr:carbohydrate ABC transporter permease [Desulfotomaculum sp.]MCL0081169.1 carbohydrate ABC transporter permease [Peptococcaceae bacterium]
MNMVVKKTPPVARDSFLKTLQKKWHLLLAYLLLTIFSLPIGLMFLWLFLTSISTHTIAGVIPAGFTLEHWSFLWGPVEVGGRVLPSIWQATWNTILFAGGLTIFEVIISTMAGYTLSRMNFPGRKLMLRSVLILHAFPGVLLLIAIFYVLNALGLIDTLWGVMLVKVALQIPLSIYIIKGFFDEVSWDIEWAALVDGCNRLTVWYQVILPQVKPGIAAISIFSFIAGWSEFLLLFTFIFSEHNNTLAIYLLAIIGDFRVVNYGLLAAAALFYIFPVLLFFLFTQKFLMKMNMGGGKQV